MLYLAGNCSAAVVAWQLEDLPWNRKPAHYPVMKRNVVVAAVDP